MEHRDVGGVQHHNRLAIVASLFHEPARALEVRLARSPGARSVLAFADEVRAALPIVLCLADGGLQVALLVDHVRERLPRLLIVEGWLEMVRADPPLVADDVVGDDADGRVALDLGDVVQGRLLPEVNLACLKRRGGGRLARASRTRPKGLPSSSAKLFLSVACNRSVAAIKNWPSGSRWLQRRRETTQSSAVTAWPSWNLSPSRSVKLHLRRSGLTVHVSTICGRIWPFSSCEKSVS